MIIDWWTLGLQTVNVAVLIWLLQRFFWRPVAGIVEARRRTIGAALANAEADKAKAAAALVEIDKTRAGFAQERGAIQAAARESAEQDRSRLLAEAEKEAAALRDAAKSAIAKEREAASAAWSLRSSRLAVEIAGRLAGRLDGAAVRSSFLEWLIKAITALPDVERHASGLEAISATALDPTEQERATRLIGKAFGGEPTITFRIDPALIAGLELHGPHLVIRNSWQADLAKILEDLNHGS